jgi:electron transfer flavoprotein beta subunit
MVLNIIVCIKQVPDTAELPKVDPAKAMAGDEGVARIVNPWDEYAIEEALRLREKHGGKVTALTMGPERAVEALRKAVAMGADEAILLDDPAFAGSDAGATAYILAAAIRKIGTFDLILCGKQSVDSDSGQVAVGVARYLRIPPLTFVAKVRALDVAARRITVERLLEEGREVVQAPLPVLLSVVKEINEPRYPAFLGIRKAAKLQPPVWGVKELGLAPEHVGARGSATRWTALRKPPARASQCEIIQGATAAEKAARLVDRLLAEKII